MSNIAPYFVAIGASGGEGLHDIIDLLSALPRPLAAVVMVVLHRPSDKVSSLREVLAREFKLPVVIAAEAETLVPDTCYIGEPAGHLTLVDRHIAHLVPGANHRLRNRTVDALFNSLAKHAGERTTGIVLSGSLDDGSRGLKAIKAAGGTTMVLEPRSSFRGMQQNAIDYDGPIDFIGTSRDIAEQIRHAISRADQSIDG